jgi:hypothetical protein
MRLTLIAAVAALAAATAPSIAAAQDAAATLRKFGLLGEFSKDCAQPASIANAHTLYVAQPDGTVKLSYDSGGGQSGYLIHAARILSPALILLEETSDAGTPFQVIVNLDGKRIRVIESRDPKSGRAFVAGGVITGNNRETSWETRCR